jgi:hypothetical protein
MMTTIRTRYANRPGSNVGKYVATGLGRTRSLTTDQTLTSEENHRRVAELLAAALADIGATPPPYTITHTGDSGNAYVWTVAPLPAAVSSPLAAPSWESPTASRTYPLTVPVQVTVTNTGDVSVRVEDIPAAIREEYSGAELDNGAEDGDPYGIPDETVQSDAERVTVAGFNSTGHGDSLDTVTVNRRALASPRFYAVTAQVTRTRPDGWTTSRQVPTFYLNTAVQGILTDDHAHRVAAGMLADLVDDPDADIVVTAVRA